jgi:hypothetical protein
VTAPRRAVPAAVRAERQAERQAAQHEAIRQAARELADTCPPLAEWQLERLRVLLDLGGRRDDTS